MSLDRNTFLESCFTMILADFLARWGRKPWVPSGPLANAASKSTELSDVLRRTYWRDRKESNYVIRQKSVLGAM